MKDLSVIIVSYNTSEITTECLRYLQRALSNEKKLTCEVIIIDNASHDDSKAAIERFIGRLPKNLKKIEYQTIWNKKNVGYGKANNQGLKQATGKYILLLNSDAYVKSLSFETLLDYMDTNPEVGVLTVKVVLPSGKLDPAAHRGFPTIWRSLTFFAGLENATRHIPILNQLFGGYHLTHMNMNAIHEIDSPAGAFFLSRKSILDKVKGFDTTFFMYGEDLDLSYRIKELGYKVIFYPHFSILHYKHASGIKKKDKEIAKRTKYHFYEAMKIFYDKHYAGSTPDILNRFIHWAIDFKYKL